MIFVIAASSFPLANITFGLTDEAIQMLCCQRPDQRSRAASLRTPQGFGQKIVLGQTGILEGSNRNSRMSALGH